MNRRAFLENLKSMNLATEAEVQELENLPKFVGGQDGGVMVVPGIKSPAEFCRSFKFVGREATDDEVRTFLNGPAIIVTGTVTPIVDEQTSGDEMPVDEMPAAAPADATPWGDITRHEPDEQSKQSAREHAQRVAGEKRAQVRARRFSRR
jgi:hypothetical protein